MKKWLLTIGAAGMLTVAMAMPAMAASWQQDQVGWWYQNDDGSYLKDGWNWIDGRCYYFNSDGYCLLDTVTPDGYTVDVSGAWTVDGVVQVQETQEAAVAASEQIAVGNLHFTVPEGFVKAEALSSATISYFVNGSMDAIVGVVSEKFPDMAGYEGLIEAMAEKVLDAAMQTFGTVDEKTMHQFATGTWYRYRYADTQSLGIPGQFYAYARIVDAQLQMVVFAGNMVGVDMTEIMNQNLQ